MNNLNNKTYEKYKSIILKYMQYKISIGDDSLTNRTELSNRFNIKKNYVGNILMLMVKEKILEKNKSAYYKLIN